MTVAAALLVTAVVWSISLIRSVRLRALVYSLPLPMTLVLIGSDVRVDGAQLLGVALLVLFFAVVTVARERLGWPILLADAAGVAVYVTVAALVARADPVPFWPAFAAVCALWLAASAMPSRDPAGITGDPAGVAGDPAPRRGADAAGRRGARAALAKLVAVFAAAVLTVGLGGLLSGLVVTFPYSGVLVAVEARGHLAAFTRRFARVSIALVAFVTGYYLLSNAGEAAALAAGWLAYGAVALALHARRDR